MILTVTLNASIDKLYIIDELKIENTNRIKSIEKSAGGKGINVSRVLSLVGVDQIATGICGGENGRYILNELAREKIDNDFLYIDKESRENIHVSSLLTHKETNILEAGFNLNALEEETFIFKYKELLKEADLVVLSGSIPKGASKDIYAKLIKLAKERNIKTILDTSGEPLRKGIEVVPDYIKPNREEFELLINQKAKSDDELIEEASLILEKGIKACLITGGENGLYAVSKDAIYHLVPPKIDLISSTGSGDAFVAGFAYGIEKNLDYIETLKVAVAFGTLNAMDAKTGYIAKEKIESIKEQIKVIKIK